MKGKIIMTSLFLTGALIGFTIILFWLLKGFKTVFTNAESSLFIKENFLRMR